MQKRGGVENYSWGGGFPQARREEQRKKKKKRFHKKKKVTICYTLSPWSKKISTQRKKKGFCSWEGQRFIQEKPQSPTFQKKFNAWEPKSAAIKETAQANQPRTTRNSPRT